MTSAAQVIYARPWTAVIKAGALWSFVLTSVATYPFSLPFHLRVVLFLVACTVVAIAGRLLSRVQISSSGARFVNRAAARALSRWPSAESAQIRAWTDGELVLVLDGSTIPVRLLLADGVAQVLPPELLDRLSAAAGDPAPGSADPA